MTTYKDLKSAKYIESIINYAEGLLKRNFKRTGNNRYSAYCPFHVDNKDSFRVYVNGKDEVRFHCFGECKVDWDIYDLINSWTAKRFVRSAGTNRNVQLVALVQTNRIKIRRR